MMLVPHNALPSHFGTKASRVPTTANRPSGCRTPAGIPKASDVAGRDFLFTPDPHWYAIDTSRPGRVLFSVS